MSAETQGHGAERARGQGNAPTAPENGLELIVHPTTGEILELEALEPDRLADALLALRDVETRARDWRKRVEAELRQRMPPERALWCVGDYEVRVGYRNESEWDADELERVVRALIDAGVVDPREVTELIRHETIVSRSEANRLLDRLSGRAHAAVQACRSWRKKAGGLEVTRSLPLLPDQD